MDSTATPELDAFQSAFGRACELAAQALVGLASEGDITRLDPERARSREAVRIAFQGHGENIHLASLREMRGVMNEMGDAAKAALIASGMTADDAMTMLLSRARASRTAVEQEWEISIPIVRAEV